MIFFLQNIIRFFVNAAKFVFKILNNSLSLGIIIKKNLVEVVWNNT